MSKKVDDFVIFCSLLRIYELYKTEAAIDMDIAHGSFDIFLQRDGDLAGEKCFLATLQIFFSPKPVPGKNSYEISQFSDWLYLDI